MVINREGNECCSFVVSNTPMVLGLLISIVFDMAFFMVINTKRAYLVVALGN
jgi:hypothetical protein